MKGQPIVRIASSGLLYLFLYAPLAVVIVYSFNEARYGTLWEGFTARWYLALRENPAAMDAVQNTLVLGGISAGVATVLGTLLGLAFARHPFPAKRFFAWLLFVPVVIPEIVMGVALMLFYSLVRDWLGLFELGLTTMILAHITFEIPFVAIVVRARLAGLDPAVEEAARDLGANPWRTFWHVTFPLVWPGMVAGGLLAFTLSLDDFVVSFFTTGPGATTLPILIYSSVKRGITPEINALATLMIVASIVATLAVTGLQRRRVEAAQP